MNKIIPLSLLFLFGVSMSVIAQTLKVTKFNIQPHNVSAARFPKEDFNKVPCGLIKVWLPVHDAKFVGNVVESINKDDEWWVYMTNGSKRITIKAVGHPPLSYEFTEPIMSNVTYEMTVAEASEEDLIQIVPHVDASYFVRNKGEMQNRLFAKVKDIEYSVDVRDNSDEDDLECFDIVEQMDFDDNGITDALIEDNYCGNLFIDYYVVSYHENGYFSISNNVAGIHYKIEKWKGKKTIVITSSNIGMNYDKKWTKKERYIFEDGQLKLVESFKLQSIIAAKEVKSSDFHNGNETKQLRLSFDLDGNGVVDYFVCTFWDRWDNLMIKRFVLNGKEIDDDYFNMGIVRIGVLSSITNGYHDLVIDENKVIKWDGKKYAFPNL